MKVQLWCQITISATTCILLYCHSCSAYKTNNLQIHCCIYKAWILIDYPTLVHNRALMTSLILSCFCHSMHFSTAIDKSEVPKDINTLRIWRLVVSSLCIIDRLPLTSMECDLPSQNPPCVMIFNCPLLILIDLIVAGITIALNCTGLSWHST